MKLLVVQLVNNILDSYETYSRIDANGAQDFSTHFGNVCMHFESLPSVTYTPAISLIDAS